uniref:Uncharacterized protein n=1 Tax=Peronospora matthiolae TaxID=2874970 RepID=A0AAV1V7N6_9STRA
MYDADDVAAATSSRSCPMLVMGLVEALLHDPAVDTVLGYRCRGIEVHD